MHVDTATVRNNHSDRRSAQQRHCLSRSLRAAGLRPKHTSTMMQFGTWTGAAAGGTAIASALTLGLIFAVESPETYPLKWENGITGTVSTITNAFVLGLAFGEDIPDFFPLEAGTCPILDKDPAPSIHQKLFPDQPTITVSAKEELLTVLAVSLICSMAGLSLLVLASLLHLAIRD